MLNIVNTKQMTRKDRLKEKENIRKFIIITQLSWLAFFLNKLKL